MKYRFLLTLIWLAGLLIACAPVEDRSIEIDEVWARPGLAGGNSAVFFKIENKGEDDVLVSAASDIANAVELHKTSMLDGVMKMEHQMSVPVPGGETEFKPGDLHVMLIGLKNDLRSGDTFDVTLTFDNAGERTLNVVVQDR